MSIKKKTIDVICGSSICNLTLTCGVCGFNTSKQVDKSILEEMDVILVSGYCKRCGEEFVNRFEMEDFTESCETSFSRRKNTLSQLFDGLREMGVDVELNTIKTKRIKKG